MYHGTSEIIKKSKIDSELRNTLLEHMFFVQSRLCPVTNYFVKPTNKFDEAVLQLLANEQYDHLGKKIEYWFQNKTTGGHLSAHCDYNEYIRQEGKNQDPDWAHRIEKTRIMSPITIATYLEVSDDLIGGELVISEQTWFDIKTPLDLSEEDKTLIATSNVNIYTPVQDEILYFYGSRNYHWINGIVRGNRKSMMINFW